MHLSHDTINVRKMLLICNLKYRGRITESLLSSESERALLARYVYTHEEFVLVTLQNDSNRTGHGQQNNNIQIDNVQNGKNKTYNTDNYVWGLTCANLNWKKCVWWINSCIIVLCVPLLMSSVREETVSVSGRSGAQSSVASTTSLHPFNKTFWSTSCFLLLASSLKMLISFSSRIWHLSTLPKAPKVG